MGRRRGQSAQADPIGVRVAGAGTLTEHPNHPDLPLIGRGAPCLDEVTFTDNGTTYPPLGARRDPTLLVGADKSMVAAHTLAV